ncbi:hypothetical protein E4U13_001564 [Claviceps humidiphila]|uniref:Uncharacterized protein n=1 Tax=Claviceps humidiphila TaxID=1294629 RepID=A0A9P7TR52_9HYPO|nr:hypothetical protein E4U13_001564 [Claviceps humidiphila]
MGRKRQLADAFEAEDLEEDLPDTLPAFDPRAMQEQIEADLREKDNRKAASRKQSLIPRFSGSTEPYRPNDLTTYGHYAKTPNQTVIPGSLLPTESGEDHSTFAAQQPDDNGEGSSIAESVTEPVIPDDFNMSECLYDLFTELYLSPENTETEIPLSAAEMAIALALENANILQSQEKYKLIMDAFKQCSIEEIRSLPDYDTLMSGAFAAGLAPTQSSS